MRASTAECESVALEHMLIQSWDSILQGLEDNRGSLNLVSIDFAKAFNRMSHQACIKAYQKKGASNQTLNLIAAFLSGRQMTVKVNSTVSRRRTINGGSLQGCVSVNALFCATIEFLQENEYDETNSSADLAQLMQKDQNTGDAILEDIPFEDNGIDVGPASPIMNS